MDNVTVNLVLVVAIAPPVRKGIMVSRNVATVRHATATRKAQMERKFAKVGAVSVNVSRVSAGSSVTSVRADSKALCPIANHVANVLNHGIQSLPVSLPIPSKC